MKAAELRPLKMTCDLVKKVVKRIAVFLTAVVLLCSIFCGLNADLLLTTLMGCSYLGLLYCFLILWQSSETDERYAAR